MTELQRSDGTALNVGDRIHSEGHCGFIRYIGPVDGTKGNWLGIEWDDSSRGKHNGSHEGKKYFSTRHPTGGSFVRPKKVSGGVSCFTAIKSRYGEEEDDNAGVVDEELFVLDSNKKKTKVEMVGAKKTNLKQSKLDTLIEVYVKNMGIYGVGNEGDSLRTETPRIQDLDISQNLLPSWHAVAMVAYHLPSVCKLNVSENKLSAEELDVKEVDDSFKSVKTLYLNRMDYNWKQILKVGQMFPCLEELHVCFNCINELTRPVDSLMSLTLLNLESNHLSSWEDVLKLSSLTRLQTLILNDNSFEDIEFPDVDYIKKTSFFSNLECLVMNQNKISKWSAINELNKLKCLKELKISNNPIMETFNPETVRQLIIAKIQTLKLLTRTEISNDERKGAEIDYLKRYGPEWLKAGGNQDSNRNDPSAEFSNNHPRFEHLVKVYGAPELSEMDQKPKTLKESLILLNITNPDNSDIVPKQKKIPATMLVQKLKTLIQRLFRVDGDIRLSYISQKMKDSEIPFENDLRQVSFYSIESGDTIYARW